MKTWLCVFIVLLGVGFGVAQVTPRQPVKPTEDETALRGAITYWIDENPNMNRRILEELAAKLEHDIGVKPASKRDEAGMVLVVDVMTERVNAFGVVISREYGCAVFVKGQYVWLFKKGVDNMVTDPVQVVSYGLGWHVVKKWKKANK